MSGALGAAVVGGKLDRLLVECRGFHHFLENLHRLEVPVRKPELIHAQVVWLEMLLRMLRGSAGRKALPENLLHRVRWCEESLLGVRFEIEQWSTFDVQKRLTHKIWHDARMEAANSMLYLRICRLASDSGVDIELRKRYEPVHYDGSLPLKDRTTQLVWRKFFGDMRPIVTCADFFHALQNELRELGRELLSHQEIRFLQTVLEIRPSEIITGQELQSFIDRYAPAVRNPTDPLLDAIRWAMQNFLESEESGETVPWFKSGLDYAGAYTLLSTSDPGTYVVRPSSEDISAFALQWTSAGRQVKNARIYTVSEGFSWRLKGGAIYQTMTEMLREVRKLIRQPLRMPRQVPPDTTALVMPEDEVSDT